jgi:hypothetical protein
MPEAYSVTVRTHAHAIRGWSAPRGRVPRSRVSSLRTCDGQESHECDCQGVHFVTSASTALTAEGARLRKREGNAPVTTSGTFRGVALILSDQERAARLTGMPECRLVAQRSPQPPGLEPRVRVWDWCCEGGSGVYAGSASLSFEAFGRHGDVANLSIVTADRRVSDGQFVAFGPEQAIKAREAAHLPDPPVVTDVPHDASLIRRLWALLTRGSDDHRKLWTSE